MAKAKAPKIRIQQTVKTTRFIAGYPVGIPTDSMVTVKATSSGRFQVESPAGTLLWCDADSIAPLA